MSVSQLIDFLLTKQYSELDKYITEISKNGIKLQLIVSLVNSMTLIGLNKDAVDGLRNIFCQSAFRYYMYENTQLLPQLINMLPVTDDTNSYEYMGFLLFIFETIFRQSLLQFNELNQTPLHQLLYKIQLNNGINKNFVPQFLYQVYQRINDRQVFDRLLREQDHLSKSSYDYLQSLAFIEGESIQLVIKLISQFTPSANQRYIKQQEERQIQSKILNTSELDDHITQNIVQNIANTIDSSELKIQNLESIQQPLLQHPQLGSNLGLTITNIEAQQTLPTIQSQARQNDINHDILLTTSNDPTLQLYPTIHKQYLQQSHQGTTLPEFIQITDNTNQQQGLFKDLLPQSNYQQQPQTTRNYRYQKLLQSGTQSNTQQHLLSYSNSQNASNISSNKRSNQSGKMEVIIGQTVNEKPNSQPEKYIIVKDKKFDSFIDEAPSQIMSDTDFSFSQNIKSPQVNTNIDNIQEQSPQHSGNRVIHNEITLQQNLVQNDLPDFVPKPQLPPQPQIVHLAIQTSELSQSTQNQQDKQVYIQLIDNSENKTIEETEDQTQTSFSVFNSMNVQVQNQSVKLKNVQVGHSLLNCSGITAEQHHETSVQATQNQQNKSTQFIQDKKINQTTSNLLSTLGKPNTVQSVVIPTQVPQKSTVKVHETQRSPVQITQPQVVLVRTPQFQRTSTPVISPQRSPEIMTQQVSLQSSEMRKSQSKQLKQLQLSSQTSTKDRSSLSNNRVQRTKLSSGAIEPRVQDAKKINEKGVDAFSQTLKIPSTGAQTHIVQSPNTSNKHKKVTSKSAQTAPQRQPLTSPKKIQIENVAIDNNENVYLLSEPQKKRHVRKQVDVEVLSKESLKTNRIIKKHEENDYYEKEEQQKQVQTDAAAESVKFHIELQNLVDKNAEALKSIVGNAFHVDQQDITETARNVCGDRSHILSNIHSELERSHVDIKSQLQSLINLQRMAGSQLTQTELQYQQTLTAPQQVIQPQIEQQYVQQQIQSQALQLQQQSNSQSISSSASIVKVQEPSMLSIVPMYAEMTRSKQQPTPYNVQQLQASSVQQQQVQQSFDQSIPEMLPLQPTVQFGENGVQTIPPQQKVVELVDVGVGRTISRIPTISSNIESPTEPTRHVSENLRDLQMQVKPPQKSPQRRGTSVLRAMTEPIRQMTTEDVVRTSIHEQPTNTNVSRQLSRQLTEQLSQQQSNVPITNEAELKLSQILAAGSARIAAGQELLDAPKPKYDVSDIPSLKMSDRFMTQYQVRQQSLPIRSSTTELPQVQQLSKSATIQLQNIEQQQQQPSSQLSPMMANTYPQMMPIIGYPMLPSQTGYMMPQQQLPVQYSQLQQTIQQNIPQQAQFSAQQMPQVMNSDQIYNQNLQQQPPTYSQQQQVQGNQQLQTQQTHGNILAQSNLSNDESVCISIAKMSGRQKVNTHEVAGTSVQCEPLDDLTLSDAEDMGNVNIQSIGATSMRKSAALESKSPLNLVALPDAPSEKEQKHNSHEVSVKLSKSEIQEQLDDIVSPHSGSTIMSSARFSKMVQSHPDKSIGGLVPDLLKAAQ